MHNLERWSLKMSKAKRKSRTTLSLTCLNLISFSSTRLLIWITKPNIAAANKKAGPTVPTVESVLMAGCANSVKEGLHSKLESAPSESERDKHIQSSCCIHIQKLCHFHFCLGKIWEVWTLQMSSSDVETLLHLLVQGRRGMASVHNEPYLPTQFVQSHALQLLAVEFDNQNWDLKIFRENKFQWNSSGRHMQLLMCPALQSIMYHNTALDWQVAKCRPLQVCQSAVPAKPSRWTYQSKYQCPSFSYKHFC